MGILDFLGNQQASPTPNMISRIGTKASEILSNPGFSALAKMGGQDDHMAKVFAANPAFAAQLYGAKNNQLDSEVRRQTALQKLQELSQPKYEQVGGALLKLLPNGSGFEVAYEGKGDLPAAVQIANEVEKALQSGDIDRANRLMQIQKVYDKGVNPYGYSQPRVDAGALTNGINPNAPHPLEPSLGNPTKNNQFLDIASQSNPELDALAAQIEATMPDISGPIQPPSMGPQAMPGYGNAVGQIAADKKRMETQAQKDVELGMNPLIAGAETAAKSDATYKQEGKQALPSQERALQSAELRNDFLKKKSDELLQQAGAFTTGFGGALTDQVPGSPAYDLKANVDTLLANAGFDRLQEMRDNSPTGGALGSVSERELGLLMSAAQALQVSQSPAQFKKNLADFMTQRDKSLENIRKAYAEDYARFGGDSDPQLPAPKGLNTTPQSSEKKVRLKYNRATGKAE